MPKSIRDLAHEFAVGYRIESRETRNEDISIFLKDLSSIVLDALPSVSKELKLDAREKFIWLTAVKECGKEISNIILGG